VFCLSEALSKEAVSRTHERAVSRCAINMDGELTLGGPPPATPWTVAPGSVTRACPTTVGSSTRSTPTRARSSAGWSTIADTSRCPAPGTACRPRSRVWRRADAARTLVPGDLHDARLVERHPGRRVRHRGVELPDRRGSGRGRLGSVPGRELPAPPGGRCPRARVPRRAGDRWAVPRSCSIGRDWRR
jgi:hypothetical protein